MLLLLLLLMVVSITIEQQQPESVLLHGSLVGRWRRAVLELGVHHGRVGVVWSAVGGRDPRQEPPAGFHDALPRFRDGSRRQGRSQTEHCPAGRRVLRCQSPRYAAHRDQYDAHACRVTKDKG